MNKFLMMFYKAITLKSEAMYIFIIYKTIKKLTIKNQFDHLLKIKH